LPRRPAVRFRVCVRAFVVRFLAVRFDVAFEPLVRRSPHSDSSDSTICSASARSRRLILARRSGTSSMSDCGATSSAKSIVDIPSPLP
jgi:hypothetical protein